MRCANSQKPEPTLGPWTAAALGGGALACFHVAFAFERLAGLMLVFLYCLVRLAELRTGRQAFYVGLAIGVGCYAPHLAFFWGIFGPAAAVLWLILAVWIGLFLALARLSRGHFHPAAAVLLIPCLWTGLEYFRSELYYLRFSWLSPGYALAEAPHLFTGLRCGVYGMGFLLTVAAAVCAWVPRLIGGTALVVWALGLGVVTQREGGPAEDAALSTIHVAGVQLESPAPAAITAALDQTLDKHPRTELLVLSEYTFDGPIPEPIRRWCREHRRHLIVGGAEPLPGGGFYNTAFVVGPEGDVVFRQAKSVPIQFFRDGLPAPERSVWSSPWGKIGLCICYDLNYRRVMDDFVRQGAQALIVPTMDVADWGRHQHRLHARTGPVRAAEYGLPIFRVASSGISQLIDASGLVTASAPFPGQGKIIAGELRLRGQGRLPWDGILAPLTVAVSGGLGLGLAWRCWRETRSLPDQPLKEPSTREDGPATPEGGNRHASVGSAPSPAP